jgi:oligopeptide/dipeptide ABC transporter ATP-binding protein
MTSGNGALLQIRNLKKHFSIGGNVLSGLLGNKTWLKAVDGINLDIEAGTTYGLVGESGCGKSTTAKMVLMLEEPTEGEIIFEGENTLEMNRSARKKYKASVQAVFQDPWSSLNPRMRVEGIVAEPMEVNTSMTKGEIRTKVGELLEEVGLQSYQANLYPHEFSGGQRQRIGVARALALNPKLIVLDEPVSALDVSIRAQIMNLLMDLQKEHGLTYLLIAHHLATVRYMCDKIGVMYLGRLVEESTTDELYDNPLHPYTRALMSAALPSHPDDDREEIILSGEVPSPINPPSGCHFHERCPSAIDTCSTVEPTRLFPVNNHGVVCHLYNQ